VVLTYTLLALAVLALWFGGDERAPALRRMAWLVLLVAAVGAGLVHGIVQPVGLAGILGFAAVVRWFSRTGGRPRSWAAAGSLVLAGSVGLALHLVPGFANVRVVDAVRLGADAVPYTLYLNFDKTLIGLFILGWCHQRIARGREWRVMLAATAPRAAGVIALLLLLSLAAGYVRFEPKFPAVTWLWLGVNLLFTCCAEETLFRGFIQAELQRRLGNLRPGRWLALGVAAVLFGLAHFQGGAAYVALATVAGLGYGWVYQRTGRIEAAILTHFALNTVHFFFFTYPALAR